MSVVFSHESLQTCPNDLFWSDPFSSSFFVLYTMVFLPFPSSTCGLGVQSSFSPSLLPFHESSILSWKAARSLFMYHLHINAARRLAGKHLMWRQQYPQIFVFFSLLPFILYFLIHFVAKFVRGVTLRD